MDCEEVVDKSAVGARSGHDGEVANLVAVGELSDRDRALCAVDLLECGL